MTTTPDRNAPTKSGSAALPEHDTVATGAGRAASTSTDDLPVVDRDPRSAQAPGLQRSAKPDVDGSRILVRGADEDQDDEDQDDEDQDDEDQDDEDQDDEDQDDEDRLAHGEATQRDPRRPAFLDDLPETAELKPLVAAFVEGNYALLRQLERALPSQTSDPETLALARELVERTEPDPLSKVILGLSVLFFLFIVGWVYLHHAQ